MQALEEHMCIEQPRCTREQRQTAESGWSGSQNRRPHEGAKLSRRKDATRRVGIIPRDANRDLEVIMFAKSSALLINSKLVQLIKNCFEAEVMKN